LSEKNLNIDWFVFTSTIAVIVGVCIPLVLAPEWGSRIVNSVFEFVTTEFGVLYIWTSIATLIFLIWLALSHYGVLRLSDADEPPEFSNFSWASMIFCAGIGSALIYWATIEWAFYYSKPPFGLESGTMEAIEWIASYGIFHWGFTGWALYCLPAVALSYAYHVRGIPYLRISSACGTVLGKQMTGPIGRCIDIFVMVGLIGAAATSLGFSTPVISAAMSQFSGIQESFTMTVIILIILSILFALSVYFGIEKGIKRLSNINTIFALGLVVFILIVGPTEFILKLGTNSVGHIFQNYIKMSAWTDPISNSGFVESWTIFYWAWWIALGPFVGIFVTKISRGRTIRELVFGMLGYGSLGCAIFFIVLGNYALYLELNELLPVVQIVEKQSPGIAIAKIISTLPFGHWILPVVSIIALIFSATTYDSASYTLASGATRNLTAKEHPARWHRVFWAFALTITPITLLFLGGLKTLQSATVIVSLPLIFIFVLMAVSLIRSLQQDRHA